MTPPHPPNSPLPPPKYTVKQRMSYKLKTTTVFIEEKKKKKKRRRRKEHVNVTITRSN